ncbi:MAG: LysM peptidoglycan-binding domain-containing protein, partial [Myxococcota bacterium]|nr:LysM peptidoglycan-binding domain-containing protein [Myxococcota bacterium]
MRHGSAARAGDDLMRRMKQGAKLAQRAEPPAWSHGVPRPPSDSGYDLPRSWSIRVGRGETLSLLERWSGQPGREIRRANKGTFRRRKGTHRGDQLVMVMSPNQKLAFDRARETFQTRRIESYFSKRYIAKVVRYVVKRGDVISRIAKRYGTSPDWLLADFNQKDFRTLQPGDTVLIPVVKELPRGRRSPPPLKVVDSDGNSLAGPDKENLDRQLASTRLLGRARVAVDDSSVFERPLREVRKRSVPTGVLPTGLSHLVDGMEPTAFSPRPSTPLIPVADFPSVDPEPVANRAPQQEDRPVVIRKGETLGHLAKWSGLSFSDIQERNLGLQPDRLLIGQKVVLPLTDEAFSDFVLARLASRKTPPTPPSRAVPARPAKPRPIAASIKSRP